MRVGVPREIRPGETRVSLTPGSVAALMKHGHEVLVQSGSGAASHLTDAAYAAAGATVVSEAHTVFGDVDVVVKVRAPWMDTAAGVSETDQLHEGQALIALMAPFLNPEIVGQLAQGGVSTFALELLPRTTRAQSMDVLSSMSTLAGYKAVLMAAERLPRIFPLLTTAAGTVPPANVLILGAGVAGLQAMATAKRIGARVEAFDPRAECKEQVESVGAKFIPIEGLEDVGQGSGYARQQSDEFLACERSTIAARLSACDVVITTAQVFGSRAPRLITAEMVDMLPRGAVVIDLAAETGGNCELTRPDVVVDAGGVTICGPTNLPATLPVNASAMFSKNVSALFEHVYADPEGTLNLADEITDGVCLTHGGVVRNEAIRTLIERGGVGADEC